MPKSDAIWGIDVGQCALKAMRCTFDEEEQTVVADAFDYIEYPKVLSQPEAEPEELVREALEQFLSRNEVVGDQVAISVSGQAGLSRFFKPPPVDAKRLPEIVKYEARQQIPFALEDVIWDWEQMGGQDVDGFIMDAEIGLFAMKRDAVFRALQPFTDADVEIDFVQLAPITVYNVICKELLPDLPEPEEIDPENPPESIIVMSMGTETTDLIITNGLKMWQRSVPLGGNHFTKQLTKELKLTYAKAEHLKRNVRQAEDPKTIFQVMRPVYNDLVTEVQRSINFFQSIDREATIGRIVMLGNAVKLPGLRQYLSKNLGHEAAKVDSYEHLSGATVVSSPSFKENINSFAVCYGLCLQGLNKARLTTNLLPREFVTERLIRDKKPWALASVGALLLALSFNFYFHYDAWSKTRKERETDGKNWETAMAEVQSVANESSRLIREDRDLEVKREHVFAVRDELLGGKNRQDEWLELITAIHKAIPKDDWVSKNQIPDPEKVPFVGRETLYIEYLETQYFEDLKHWFNGDVADKYREELRIVEQAEEDATADAPEKKDAASEKDAPIEDPPPTPPTSSDPFGNPGQPEEDPNYIGPTGSGWVIEIKGHHYHNKEGDIVNDRIRYLRKSLFKNLREMEFRLPGYGVRPLKFEDLGIGFAIVYRDGERDNGELSEKKTIPNPNHPDNAAGGQVKAIGQVGNNPFGADAGGAAKNGAAKDKEKDKDKEEFKGAKEWEAPRYDFIVQFVWQPEKLRETKRDRELEIKRQREAKAKAAEAGDTKDGADAAKGGA